jgi:hypothetical protein
MIKNFKNAKDYPEFFTNYLLDCDESKIGISRNFSISVPGIFMFSSLLKTLKPQAQL